jgi:oligoendopeptidase F
MTATLKTLTIPERKQRTYLSSDFKVEKWETIKPYFEELKSREISSTEELERWMFDRSELESVLSEELGWRYIRMTCDTQNEETTKAFQYFVSEIEPEIAPYDHELNLKLMHSPYEPSLEREKYKIYLRSIERALEIFREENIPLQTEISTKQQQFASVSGAMTVTLDGEEMTLQRAADRLKRTDRAVREETWRTVQERRYQDHEKLDNLFDELLKLRHQVAVNASFDNFRDYMFAAMGRFDYTPQDCFDFHTSIQETIVPLLTSIDEERKQQLGVDTLRPWDLDVDPSGRKPLEPFKTGDELLEKTVQVFYKLDIY